MKLRKKSPILICVDIQMGFLEEEYWGGGISYLSFENGLEDGHPIDSDS